MLNFKHGSSPRITICLNTYQDTNYSIQHLAGLGTKLSSGASTLKPTPKATNFYESNRGKTTVWARPQHLLQGIARRLWIHSRTAAAISQGLAGTCVNSITQHHHRYLFAVDAGSVLPVLFGRGSRQGSVEGRRSSHLHWLSNMVGNPNG